MNAARPSAKERIDRAAYELFSKRGVNAVGVDAIVAHAGVAKRTLYKHYPSKDELALAFLRRREELWTSAWLQAEVELRAGGEPRDKLLAIFDAFDRWFHRRDFEACPFVRALLEFEEPEHRVRKAAARHMRTIHDFIAGLAAATGLRNPEDFARAGQMLMAGSIIAACAGDRDAAKRAKQAGAVLLAEARRTGRAG